jgi:hypothetical protein
VIECPAAVHPLPVVLQSLRKNWDMHPAPGSIESGRGTLAGEVGAIFVFNSPPASSTAEWQTDNLGEILSFQILDATLNAFGGSAPMLEMKVVSTTG